MAELGGIYANISADTKEFDEALDHVEKRAKQTEKQTAKAAGKLSETLGGAGGLTQAAQQTRSAFGSIAGIANRLPVMVGALIGTRVVSGLKDFAAESISIASSLDEVQNVVDVTFGRNAEQINVWAKAAGKSFGLTELQAKQYASTIGAMGKSLGVTDDELVGFSEDMASRASDLASFYNLDFDEAFNKIRAGIAGETEPLKALGVLMTEDNLSAYALEKGMHKAFSKMNAHEKTMIRYQYLMDKTADSQGDFARTSDGLANAGRMLETQWTELKATAGRALLPLAEWGVGALSDLVQGVNDLFAGAEKDALTLEIEGVVQRSETLRTSIEKAQDGYDKSMAGIDAKQAMAKDMLDQYDALASKENRTEADTARMRTIVRSLVNEYPGLKSSVSSVTGLFTAQRTEIDSSIESMSNYARKTAALGLLTQKYTQLAEVQLEQTNAQKKAAKAYAEFQPKNDAWRTWAGMTQAIEDEYSEIENRTEDVKSQTAFVDAWISKMAQVAPEAAQQLTDKWNEYGTAASDRASDLYKAAFELEGTLQKETETSSKNYFDAKEAAASYSETITDLNTDILTLKATSEEYGATAMDQAQAHQTGIEHSEEYKAALADLEKASANVTEAEQKHAAAQKELNDYTATFLTTAKANVDSVFGAFERGGRVGAKSLNGLTNAMKGQQDYWNQYNSNLEKAKQMGEEGLIPQDVLEQLSDGSKESAQVLAGLAKANPKQIAAFVAQWQATHEAEAQAAEGMAEVASSSEEAQAQMATLQGAVDSAAQEMEEAKQAAADLKTALDALAAKEYTILIRTLMNGTPFWTGGADVKGLQEVSARAQQHGRLDMKFASGLDYVPRDDYPAMLHRGERVLTRADAEAMRRAEIRDDHSSSVTVSGNTFVIRSQTDIEDLSREIAGLTARKQRGRGVYA